MLASNQPYQRVDDGVGAGFIAGGVVGGAVAGGFHSDFGRKAVKTGARSLKNHYKNAIFDLQDKAGMLPTEKQEAKINKLKNKHQKAAGMVSGVDNLHQKAFGGGGWRKAAVYGGSVLAGGILGMGADALND